MTAPLLQLQSISKFFGGIRAVDALSFDVGRNEVVGLIGPNGSGKSTTVNLLSGALGLSAGEIRLNDEAIGGLAENDRVSRGLARTFQTATYFTGFTTREQVLLGCHSRTATSDFGAVFRTPSSRREQHRLTQKVTELLDFVGLGPVADLAVESLSSGQQRLLMIATALASDPKVLLVDEPAAGMVASERSALGELLLNIKARGISVIVIEHHMSLIMGVCDRIVVLNFGQKIAEGIPPDIRQNPASHRRLPGRKRTDAEGARISRPVTARSGCCTASRFDVNEGECVALIGANGAGKTTTLKCICGLVPAQSGTIAFQGKQHPASEGPRHRPPRASPCVRRAVRCFRT